MKVWNTWYIKEIMKEYLEILIVLIAIICVVAIFVDSFKTIKMRKNIKLKFVRRFFIALAETIAIITLIPVGILLADFKFNKNK